MSNEPINTITMTQDIIFVQVPAIVEKPKKANAAIVFGKYRFFYRTRVQKAAIMAFVKLLRSGYNLETAIKTGDIRNLKLPKHILTNLGI
jgi:hypothetical protein